MNVVEDWEKSILTLPDPVFFNLIRNYIGDIATPFDKHVLVKRLVEFLGRREVHSRLFSMITPRDARLLSAVEALADCCFEHLCRLLEEDYSVLELNQHLGNLENRLLIYRGGHDDSSRYSLNPLLAKDLRERVCGLGNLIGGEKTEVMEAESPWLCSSFLLAALSHFFHSEVRSKKNGELTKNATEGLLRIFPVLKEEGKLHLVGRALRALGLLVGENIHTRSDIIRPTTMRPDMSIWYQLASLERRDCHLVVWAAASGGAPDFDGGLDEWYQAAFLLRGFFECLERGYAFDLAGLEKLYLVLTSRLNLPLPSKQAVRSILRTLVSLNLLPPVKGGRYTVNPLYWSIGETAQGSKPVTIQPNFEVSTAPELGLREGLMIALACRIKRFDLVPTFEISRASIKHLMNRGYSTDVVLESLRQLSAKPVPQNVVLTLQSWERDLGRVILYDGVVLATDGDGGVLLEHILEDYIYKKLGEGLYLLDRSERSKWEGALQKADIDFLPAIGTEGSLGRRVDRKQPGHLRLPGLPKLPGMQGLRGQGQGERFTDFDRPPWDRRFQNDSQKRDAVEEELLTALGKKSGELTDVQIEEIRRRIDDRLILLEEQLAPLHQNSVRNEARGLDYIGKVRLIEQAKKENALLEVIERGRSGEPRKRLLRVEDLEKSASDLVLVAWSVEDRKKVRIRVGKMGLVRKRSRNPF